LVELDLHEFSAEESYIFMCFFGCFHSVAPPPPVDEEANRDAESRNVPQPATTPMNTCSLRPSQLEAPFHAC
jgi:hypothetical protein